VPSASFTHKAVAAVPPAEVWESLQLPATWQSIGGVDRVYDPVFDADGTLRGFSFETMVGGKLRAGTATPYDREEGRRIAWRVESHEISGVTTVDLTAEGSGTAITVRLDVASAGMLSAMFFPAIAGAIGIGLPAAVEDFAAGF